MKKLSAIAIGALLAANVAMAGFIDSGFFASGFVEDGFFEADASQVAVPNVIGSEDSSAADTTLEGEGLDLGGATARCYPRGTAPALDEVIGQTPSPGTLVDPGTLVYVLVSNDVECVLTGRPGLRVPGLRFPGL